MRHPLHLRCQRFATQGVLAGEVRHPPAASAAATDIGVAITATNLAVGAIGLESSFSQGGQDNSGIGSSQSQMPYIWGWHTDDTGKTVGDYPGERNCTGNGDQPCTIWNQDKQVWDYPPNPAPGGAGGVWDESGSPIRSAGLAPEANGALVAMRAAANAVNKTLKQQGPRVRNIPGETPNPLKKTPTEEAIEDALKQCVETLAEIVAKIGQGGASILMPIPDILLHPGRVPGNPNGGSALF